MAAVGRAVRAQIGQLCAARQYYIRVAGFRTTSQAVLDQGQSAFCRDTLSGYSRGFATKDGADHVTGAGKASATSGDVGEEMRVDTMVRDELEEPAGGTEPGLKEKAKQAVSRVGEKVKEAGKAIKSSTENETVDTVGDKVKGAGDTLKDKGTKKTGLGSEDVVTS